MIELSGIGISKGITTGTLWFPQFNEAPDYTNMIVCVECAVPSSVMREQASKIIGICILSESAASHAVVLAKSMGIPAIIGVKALVPELSGKDAIIDGTTGKIYVEPDDELIAEMGKKRDEETHRREILQGLKGKENMTLDGRKIDILASVSNIQELGAALENDASGIGLFRSEFLFLEERNYPTEELQFQYYRHILERMSGKQVVIRTFDFGWDKKPKFLKPGDEENPAMGYRGIRGCLGKPELFKVQLRALYRASIYGNLGIMFPMVTSVDEILAAKTIIRRVKDELLAEGIKFRNDVEVGIMIETPAAALTSDRLAKEADFLSIGTNDLTQFTLAADRANPKLGDFYDSYHPAVLRLIKMSADNAHANGIRIGICGEAANDLRLIEKFIDMGIDSLSVIPNMVLPLREKIRSIKTVRND